MRTRSMDLCNGPLLKNIILYTIPIMLTGILQLLFNAADQVVVGRFCGTQSLAAVGATASLVTLFVNVFTGLSVGAGATVAHAIGRKHDQDVHRAVHTAIPIALISGAFLTVFGFFAAEPMLRLMATPENILPLSALYLRIYFIGIIPSLLFNYGAAILRAAGDTRGPLIYLSCAGVLNVGLNILFVTVIKMDVAGVAAATGISNSLAAFLVLRSLATRNDACRLELRKLKIYKKSLLRILKIGIPAGIQGTVFASSNVLVQSSINSFGDVAVAGNSAAISLGGFVYTAINAYYQPALNFTGQNLGAQKYDRISKVRWTTLACTTVTGLIIAAHAFILARPLLSIYISDSPEAIEYGRIRIMYMCLPYFLCGCMDVMSGMLRGLGASFSSMIISIIGVVGFRVSWILLVFNQVEALHTLPGIYISYPISWIATFAVQMIWFQILFGRIKKKGTADQLKDARQH